MHRPSSPPNPSDGASAVKDADCSGGDPQPTGATGASAQTSSANDGGNPISAGGGGIGAGAGGGGEPDSPKCCRAPASRGALQNKPKLDPSRRSSSGYISDCDSQPSSPLFPKLPTADKATQTPSLSGQVMIHAVHCAAEEQGGRAGTHQRHGLASNLPSTRRGNAVADMQMEQCFGRELRRIGDDYNRILMLGRPAGGHRQAGNPLNLLPHIHQEPVALLCVSLLLIFIGRIMYLQGSTDSPDHSQV